MPSKKQHYEPIRDISVYEFMQRIPDDEVAENYLVQLRWRGEVECPHCQSKRISVTKDRKPQPYRCKDCRKHFSVRTNTVMAQSNIGLHKFLYAVYLMSVHRKGIASLQLAREIGISQKSAWYLGMRIRKAWEQKGGLFAGPVEVDETYIGGKRKNMSNAKRKALKDTGRGAVGKMAVVGAVSRKGGKAKAAFVENTKSDDLQGFVKDAVKKGETVYTDDHKGYTGLSGHGYEHESVRHSVKEYVNGMAHTNGIESFWSLLKRGHMGVYHKMSKKHLHRYVDEYSTRFNMRKQSTMAKIEQTIDGAIGTTLPYRELRK